MQRTSQKRKMPTADKPVGMRHNMGLTAIYYTQYNAFLSHLPHDWRAVRFYTIPSIQKSTQQIRQTAGNNLGSPAQVF